MSAVIDVKVHIDDTNLRQKLDNLVDDATMLEIHNLFAKMCDPYVPFLEGPLSQTIEVTTSGVRYTQPYAQYQYFGVLFKHTKDYHPLASAVWDRAMMRDHGDEFIEQVKQILIRRARKLYGG